MAPPKPDPAYDAMLRAFEAGARGQQTTPTVNNNYSWDNSIYIGHNAPSWTWTAPPPQNYQPQRYLFHSQQWQSYPQGYSNKPYPPICPSGQMIPQYVDNRNDMAVPYTPPPIFMPGTAPPPMQSFMPGTAPPPVQSNPLVGYWPPQVPPQQGYPPQGYPQQGYPPQGYPQQGYYNNYSPVFPF